MGLESSIPSTYGGVEPSFLEKRLLAGHDDASDQLVNLPLVIPVREGVSAEESSGRSTCGAALVSPEGVVQIASAPVFTLGHVLGVSADKEVPGGAWFCADAERIIA